VTGADVSVIGGVQVDLVATPVAALPAPGTSTYVDAMTMRVGGAGANAALAFAELGAVVRLFGCIGDDHFGRWILGELARAGLADELTVTAGAQTGVTVACEAPGRDRSFITSLGAAEAWAAWTLPPDAPASASVLLCDYFCAPAMRGEPTRGLLAAAREHGARTFFDTTWDPGGFPPTTRAEVQALLPLVDVFLPNGGEASALAGIAEVGAAARALQERSGGWVVVKLGAAGCHAVGPGGEEHTVPAPVVDVVDTTGAGDAFNAGLIDALANGAQWPAALEAATLLASTIVARPSSDRYAARPADAGEASARPAGEARPHV
jgi:sugar/nucleoside kinase (ribokinase family)